MRKKLIFMFIAIIFALSGCASEEGSVKEAVDYANRISTLVEEVKNQDEKIAQLEALVEEERNQMEGDQEIYNDLKDMNLDIEGQIDNSEYLKQRNIQVNILDAIVSNPSEYSRKFGWIDRFDIDRKVLYFDDLEWIKDSDLERIAELGLTDDDFPNGFYLYNENTVEEEYVVNEEVIVNILDQNFQPQWAVKEQLESHIQESVNQKIFCKFIFCEDEIVAIIENYLP